jgi:hypothetical protein
MPPSYPVTFSVDYPERELNRLSSFFRIFAVIPIAIVAALLPGAELAGNAEAGGAGFSGAVAGASLVVLPLVLMLLFRKKYPRWWYDWNLELMRFGNRIGVYVALMDDEYPSTDEQQAVHLDFAYPDAERLERGLPLVKWFLAIPHYIVLLFPRGIFKFVEGTLRWHNRVIGYALVMVTDAYPPFRLSA